MNALLTPADLAAQLAAVGTAVLDATYRLPTGVVGIVGAARLPDAIRTRLVTVTRGVAELPAVRERLAVEGLQPLPSASPAESDAFIGTEIPGSAGPRSFRRARDRRPADGLARPHAAPSVPLVA